MYSSTHSLTSALDGGEWSASRPGRFTPTERAPGTHWIGGWVGPRAILDASVFLSTKLYLHSPSTSSWRDTQLKIKHRDNLNFALKVLDKFILASRIWNNFSSSGNTWWPDKFLRTSVLYDWHQHGFRYISIC
jgi:hypothetical protein